MDDELHNALVAGQENKLADAHCKRVLAHKRVAAMILQECAEEYKGFDLDKIAACIEGDPEISDVPIDKDMTGKYRAEKIIGISEESTSLYEGSVKYDVLFKSIVPQQGTETELIINLEAQKNFNPGYSLVTRGVYYCARMLSDQKGSEFAKSDYKGLKKVHSIWICLHPAKEWQSTITTYKLAERNIKGSANEQPSEYDKLQITMICLGKPDAADSEGLLDMLEALLVDNISCEKRTEILKHYGVYDSTLESEVSEMCNYSEYIEERGMEKGMQQGIQKGMQKGELKGQLKAILALRETMLNVDLNKIMDMLKIPQGDRAFYLDEINKLEEKHNK